MLKQRLMSRIATANKLLFGWVLIGMLATSGCFMEVGVEEDATAETGVSPANLVDAELRWTIDGHNASNFCSEYGVHQWEVVVSGPEKRELYRSCATDIWSSENDLLMLAEGTYDIDLIARGPNNVELAHRHEKLDLFDRGGIETITLDFTAADFH